MSENDYGFETLQVRAGYKPEEHNYASAVPIYQTTAFNFGDTKRLDRLYSLEEEGFYYTRIANPTTEVLEKRVAALEGGTAAIALASGMAAITYALLNVAEYGGEIAAVKTLYSGSFNLFNHILPRFGIKVRWIEDSYDIESFRKAITPNTKAIFAESIGNPSISVLDIEAVAKLAHENEIPLIVDNTLPSPYLLNPIKYGADIVIHSATKAIGGHGAAIAGIIVEGGKFNWGNGKFPQFTELDYSVQNRNIYEVFPTTAFTTRIRFRYLSDFGAAISPFNSFLILQGIETLAVRVKQEVENTEEIVKYLSKHPKVAWVRYPSLQGDRNNNLAEKYLTKGSGTIFTFGFKGNQEEINNFINSLKLFSFVANIGDSKSLIVQPCIATHGTLNVEDRNASGAFPEALRLSIGLEKAEDLIADLNQAFHKVLD
ncbi:O-acetylhomoserine aminocarboxypropyltransferase/cysteine synthase family protein [Clostridium akagii]|uniref:O-acetylhomoserine aminocarboxypropyltransferase/cysteine synthase family protein n=1 Tax=Clostridium akagii TaxID=91623 RepID=UPI00047C697C|nr:O-acetylhomoserine aminocarboxypropyltransferase/cysteine synthase family protein [Clostridium akagii]